MDEQMKECFDAIIEYFDLEGLPEMLRRIVQIRKTFYNTKDNSAERAIQIAEDLIAMLEKIFQFEGHSYCMGGDFIYLKTELRKLKEKK